MQRGYTALGIAVLELRVDVVEMLLNPALVDSTGRHRVRIGEDLMKNLAELVPGRKKWLTPWRSELTKKVKRRFSDDDERSDCRENTDRP